MKQKIWILLWAAALSTAITGCTSTRRSTPVSAGPAVFQMRLVLEAPTSDSTKMSIVQQTGNPPRKEVVDVENAVLLDQTALQSAKVDKDSFGHPQIAIAFNANGRTRFAEVTRENVGKRLAIVIDGKVYSAPRIMSEISGGHAVISGSFSEQEAEELVAKLKTSLKK